VNGRKREERHERIVVAYDPSPVGSAALDAAVALAASLQAELAGLFVEDVNLLRMAALPFTRELGLTSALARPIEITDIEREFRRHAELTRKALEDAALASSVRWSFQVVRGQPLTVVLSAAEEADLLVVGRTTRAASGESGSGTRLRADASRRTALNPRARAVAALFDASEQSARVLDLARDLAGHTGLALMLLLPAATQDEFKALRERARARLAGYEGAIQVLWLRGRDLQAVARTGAEDAAVLICPDPIEPAQTAGLLGAVRCPVVFVR
jgi:nucleotide-binding universal stress UspA family protein